MARWVAGAGLAATVAGAGLLGSGAAAAASGTSATSGASATAPASGTSAGLSALEADLAGKLGVSVSTLQTALQQAETDQVQQLQSQGVISAATAQKLDQQIQAGGGPGLLMRLAGAPPGAFALLQTASQYLGIPASQIRSDLQNGQSLDAIANAQSGKSASGLQAALVAAEQAALQQKVAAGTLTASQEQTRLTGFEKHLGALLSKTGLPAPGRAWRVRWRRGPGGMGWAAGSGAPSSSSGSSSASTAGSTSSSSSSG